MRVYNPVAKSQKSQKRDYKNIGALWGGGALKKKNVFFPPSIFEAHSTATVADHAIIREAIIRGGGFGGGVLGDRL